MSVALRFKQANILTGSTRGRKKRLVDHPKSTATTAGLARRVEDGEKDAVAVDIAGVCYLNLENYVVFITFPHFLYEGFPNRAMDSFIVCKLDP